MTRLDGRVVAVAGAFGALGPSVVRALEAAGAAVSAPPPRPTAASASVAKPTAASNPTHQSQDPARDIVLDVCSGIRRCQA